MEVFDENNFDHVMFHGSQEALNKANMRKALRDMLEEGLITDEQRKNGFDQIDKGADKVLIKESNPDVDGNTIKTYLHD